MKIRTTFVYPPIPDRRFDWSAIDEDTYADMGPSALFPDCGVICLTTGARLMLAMDAARLRVRSLRRTLRGYDDARTAESWIVEAERA